MNIFLGMIKESSTHLLHGHVTVFFHGDVFLRLPFPLLLLLLALTHLDVPGSETKTTENVKSEEKMS